MNRFYLLSICLFMLTLLSCNTNKVHGQNGVSQSEEWEYERIMILDKDSGITEFPLAVFNTPPDRQIRSFVSGKVVDDLFQQNEFDIFESRVIIQIDENYVLYDEKYEISYYAIIFDFESIVSDGTNVEQGGIIGYVENSNAKMMVFSETLEPYLVISSSAAPVFYGGYFWFFPSFVTATGSTRYLSFDPVDNIESLMAGIADSLTNEPPGFALYNERVRFKTRLPQYPRNIYSEDINSISNLELITYGRTGIIAYINEINAGGYDFYLCWQNGFLDYLGREYTLNDEIWLYGIIVTYDVWTQRGYIFLRDFASVSIEEMYENRLNILRGS